MYLYDKKDSNLVIYELKAKKEELLSYKKKLLMDKYYQNKLFYSYESDNSYYLDMVHNMNFLEDGFPYSERNNLRIESNGSKYSKTSLIHRGLIEEFVFDDKLNCDFLRVKNFDSDDYNFWVTQDIESVPRSNAKVIRSIMDVPYDLVLLNKIENSKWMDIYPEHLYEIDKQLSLFDINSVDKVDLSYLDIFCKYGVVHCDKSNFDKNIKASQNILKRIKR